MNEGQQPTQELEKGMELLSTLFAEGSGFQAKVARKPHLDQFGKTVEAGDTYYSYPVGPSFSSYLKLSLESASLLVELLFERNLYLKAVAEKARDAREARLLEGIRRLMDE